MNEIYIFITSYKQVYNYNWPIDFVAENILYSDFNMPLLTLIWMSHFYLIELQVLEKLNSFTARNILGIWNSYKYLYTFPEDWLYKKTVPFHKEQ